MKKQNQFDHLINEKIRNDKIIIVGEYKIENTITKSIALKKADELGLDLVQMNIDKEGNSICKFMDYQKFQYLKKKTKKQTGKVIVKEIRFKPFIDDNDFNRKIDQTKKFLKKGNKVKLDCLFIGRGWENKKDRVLKLTYTLLDQISELGIPEQMPKIQNNKMICTIKPKK